MRLLHTLALIACLATVTPLHPLTNIALAQSIASGDGARVAATTGSRVNVRGEPEIQPDNVVAVVSGGDLVRVTEATQRGGFTWYRIESLAGTTPAASGWIRGDLLRPADLPDAAVPDQATTEPTLPELLAEIVNGGDVAVSEAVTPLPYPQRTDWSRDILRLYPAIDGCVGVNSAPPVTVLRAVIRNRGLAEVIMSDSAGRRWDCVISEAGGTPIRYDPLSGAVFIRDRLATEPFFQLGEERPRLDPNCYRFERVFHPASDAQLGWLYYRTCR